MLMKKKYKTMAELTATYETFIKGKGLNTNGLNTFNKAIKKAAKPKQRGSK